MLLAQGGLGVMGQDRHRGGELLPAPSLLVCLALTPIDSAAAFKGWVSAQEDQQVRQGEGVRAGREGKPPPHVLMCGCCRHRSLPGRKRWQPQQRS